MHFQRTLITGECKNLRSMQTHGMPPQPWIIPSKNQRGVLLCCQYSLCRVSCALGNREPGFPEKSWSTLTSSEFAEILMQPRASWALKGWRRLVWLICLVERGDLLQGGLVSLRNKKKLHQPKKKKKRNKEKETVIRTNQKCQECKLCQPNK